MADTKVGVVRDGIRAEVRIEDWPDDDRYVRVVLSIVPNTPGLHEEAYIGLVKKPCTCGDRLLVERGRTTAKHLPGCPQDRWVTPTGKVMSDSDIEALADEAERGLDCPRCEGSGLIEGGYICPRCHGSEKIPALAAFQDEQGAS